MKPQILKDILNHVEEKRGFDFSGYRTSMLERRIQKRIFASKCNGADEYFEYLKQHDDELNQLINVFTINVSRFFRNSLAFETINKTIIPQLFSDKTETNDVRIWSAGCSFGEEPYSMAILLREFLNKEELETSVNIFATDIDTNAIQRATKGIYNYDHIKNVKYGLHKKYFTKEDRIYSLHPEIKRMVRFSFYDLLDKKLSVPPDSIFGGFDIVFCRNVLIYFTLEYQKIIFNKLYNSLNKDGYLILGEAEVPVEGFQHKFHKENSCCKIYRKISH